MPSSSVPGRRGTAGLALAQAGRKTALDRARARRRHLRQRRLHPDQDDGRQRPRRLPGPPRRRTTASDRPGRRGPGARSASASGRSWRASAPAASGGWRGRRGLDLLFGEARFTGPKTVEVALNDGGTRRLTADKVFINTGARPAARDCRASTGCRRSTRPRSWSWTRSRSTCWCSAAATSAWSSARCSAASAAAVTMVQRGKQLLPARTPTWPRRWPRSCARTASRCCSDADARTASSATRAAIRLTVADAPASERTLTGSHLLVAAGRVPNTERLEPGRRRASRPTTAASSRSTSGWRPTSRASTRWATSRAGRPSRTSPTTTTASWRPTCSRAATRRPPGGWCPTPCSSTRSSAASV